MEEGKETTTFGLSSRKLVRLFAIGAEEHGAGDAADEAGPKMAEFLYDRLREMLPAVRDPDHRAQDAGRAPMTAALAGESIGELLSDPQTAPAAIRRLKEYGRELSTSAGTKAQHRVANILYYAAIAHARAHGGLKITTHTDQGLAKSFARLATEHWIPEPLRGLFARAKEACPEEDPP